MELGPTSGESRARFLKGCAHLLPFVSGARAIIEMTDVRTSGEVRCLGPFHLVVLAAWCGLVAGELEVAARFLHRTFGSTHRLFLMTRHFVWLIPLFDLALFLAAGAMLALAARRWPRRAGWLGPRLFVALALLPALILAGPGIYAEAWLLLALGVASLVAPVLERQRDRWRRRLARTAPALLALVLLQAGWLFGSDRLKRWREEGRPPPPAGAPNVLVIVLDTVRADHVSLYGYPRPTTPNLQRLARRGIRFDRRGQRRPGRSPRMRACSPASGPTSWPSSG